MTEERRRGRGESIMAEQRALSQWEIDALLNDMPGEGALMPDQASGIRRERGSSAAIKAYDFRRPDKFSKEQWATLQSIHEHFARMLGASFSSRLRTLVSVRLSSLEQGLYEEWQGQVPSPTVCYVMAMRPLSGSMVVEFGAELAAEVVDRLLGGNGSLVDRSRELGEVEFGLLRSFSRTFGHALQEMWSTVRPVEPSLQDVGQDASLIQVAAPTDVVLTAFFEMSIGNHRGQMSLCMPYTVIEPIAPSLSAQLWMAASQRHALSDDERQAMELLIDRSKVDLNVRLGGVDLPARTIAGLQEGDTFVLDARLGRPLDVVIGDRARFLALPGVVGSRLGIQIADVVEERTVASWSTGRSTPVELDSGDAIPPLAGDADPPMAG
jgi:flagellar motor switch protein FliM